MNRLRNLLLATTLLGLMPQGAANAEATGPQAADTVFEASPPAALGPATGILDTSTTLRIVLVLPSIDTAGAEAFVHSVSDPDSKSYGRFLTPQQYADRFGASAADYAALLGWAHASGLAVVRQSAARTTLTLSGDAQTVGGLFSTRLASLQTPQGRIGFAPATAPQLPPALVGKVSAVLGLVDTGRLAVLHRARNPALPHPDSGPGVLGGLSPSALQSVYVVPAPLTPSKPQTIALFEQGGFAMSDVAVYKRKYKLPNVSVVVKGVDGSGTGVVPEVDLEADLDVDMAIAINPNLKQVTVYEDAVDPFPVALVDSLGSMADDDAAQTVSISYGFDEAMASRGDELAVKAVAVQMAAQGQTLFAASGDDGAYGDNPPGLNTSFPATDPFITAVGGTTLFNLDGVYAGEEAWNLLGLGAGATGGGISTFFPLPSWQKPGGVSVASANGGSATMRNVPDVAAVADPQTGVSLYNARTGGWNVIGGTSAASPLWASFVSVLDGARAGAGLPPLGFFNPLLYRLGEAATFGLRDVADGSNGNVEIYGTPGFNAGPGYDNTTGLGSINLSRYTYSVLTEARGPGTTPSVPVKVVVTPALNSATVSWTASTGATGYLVTIGKADSGVQTANPLINQVTTANSVAISGLVQGTAYFVYVYALNESGSASPPAVFFSTRN